MKKCKVYITHDSRNNPRCLGVDYQRGNGFCTLQKGFLVYYEQGKLEDCFLTTDPEGKGGQFQDLWNWEYVHTKQEVKNFRELPSELQDIVKGTWLEEYLRKGIPNVNDIFAREAENA